MTEYSATFGQAASTGDISRYGLCFGNAPSGTVYLDSIKGVNLTEELSKDMGLEVKAALSTGSNLMAVGTSYSATSGSIPTLLPTWVDQQLYDLTRRDTPLASGLIPRVTNNGLFADYITRTAVPTAVWQTEGATLTSVSSTYVRAAKQIKYAYAVGEVSGPMMIASKIWQDALRYETEGQYRSLKYLEENTIINGDTTNATYTNAFNGLIAGITTNTSALSRTILLSDFDTAFQVIREAYGHPSLIVTDWKTFYDLKKLMREFLRASYAGSEALPKLDFGMEMLSYEGVPIIPDLFMPTTGGSRVLLVLDTQTQNNIQIRVLQDASFEELAKQADSYKFMIKMYETMIIVKEAWCYKYTSLS